MKSLAVCEKYGWAKHISHQAYYSLINREFEWELMPLALDQKIGTMVWSPLGWGRLTGKLRRGAPLPEVSRLHKTAAQGPQVEDEHLYKVVDAIDGNSCRDRQIGCSNFAQLAIAKAYCGEHSDWGSQRRATKAKP